jgi:hypothetical protein
MPKAAKPTADAYGLSLVQKGFGKTPEDDVLFALGYPHIVVATDDPIPAVNADNLYKKLPLQTTHVPRAFLARYFEALRCGADTDGIAQALAKEPPPMTDTALAKLLPKILESGEAYDYLVLEAMVGSEKLAEVTVSALEKLPSKAWDGAGGKLDTYGGDILQALYFVLLRVSKPTRTELRARLEKLYRAGAQYAGGRPVSALDVILHGRKGVERSGYRDADDELFQDLIYADDDPAWVAKVALDVLSHLKPGDWAAFDLRMAFLGGPKVMKALKNGLAKFPPPSRSGAKRQLARAR